MKNFKMLTGEIERDIERPTEEEEAYLDRYFPKGDSRRGDALVLFAFMKLQQKKIFDMLIEKCAICEKGKAIQWIRKEGREMKICQECLDDLIDEHILREEDEI
jgi:hypothetical protein